MKGQRLYDKNECESLSITCSGNSAKRYSESEEVSNSSSYGFRIDADNISYARERNEEGYNSAVHLREKNEDNISANRQMEIDHMQDKEGSGGKKNDNLNYQSSQDAIGK